MLLAYVHVLGTINLCDYALALEVIGSLFILGSQLLAVPAPCAP